MSDAEGPELLRALASTLRGRIPAEDIEALLAQSEVWEAERREHGALAEQLDAAQKRVAAFEQDRKWWQDNAIKRHKRAEERRAGRPPRSKGRT